MRWIATASLAAACLATSPLLAADLDSMPPMDQPPAISQELGSNWYIRGDVGYGQINQATVVPEAGLFPNVYQGGFFNSSNSFVATAPFNGAPIGDASSPVPVTRGNDKSVMTGVVGAGFGYRINDWFRVEADYSFSKGPGMSATTTRYCPGQANAVSNYTYAGATDTSGTGVPVGYSYDWSTCNGHLNTQQYNNTGLVMGYVDLGHWWLFSPYIGGGAGMNVDTMTGSMNWSNTSTGATYAGPTVNGSAPAIWVAQTGQVDQGGKSIYAPLVTKNGNGPQIEIGPQNWSRTINTTKYSFAGSVAAGVGIQISQSATLDIGYHITSMDLTQGFKQTLQTVNVGVRYNLN